MLKIKEMKENWFIEKRIKYLKSETKDAIEK